jgi:hypothetical protein
LSGHFRWLHVEHHHAPGKLLGFEISFDYPVFISVQVVIPKNAHQFRAFEQKGEKTADPEPSVDQHQIGMREIEQVPHFERLKVVTRPLDV